MPSCFSTAVRGLPSAWEPLPYTDGRRAADRKQPRSRSVGVDKPRVQRSVEQRGVSRTRACSVRHAASGVLLRGQRRERRKVEPACVVLHLARERHAPGRGSDRAKRSWHNWLRVGYDQDQGLCLIAAACRLQRVQCCSIGPDGTVLSSLHCTLLYSCASLPAPLPGDGPMTLDLPG